jgi:hypothetical protein
MRDKKRPSEFAIERRNPARLVLKGKIQRSSKTAETPSKIVLNKENSESQSTLAFVDDSIQATETRTSVSESEIGSGSKNVNFQLRNAN